MPGRAIFLTGADGGIGFSITKLLLAKPASTVSLVVAVDLHVDQLQTLLSEHADRLEIIAGDISQRVNSEKGINAAIDRVGRLDSIILNAGIQGPVGSLLKTDVTAWKRTFDVDFFSLIHSLRDPPQPWEKQAPSTRLRKDQTLAI